MSWQSFKYKLRRYRIILFNWEYWSFNVVYMPIYFYWFWLSIKARSFFFFSTSNPSIENAGFIMESKKAIYDILPTSFYPKTILLTKNTTRSAIQNYLTQHKLQFPLVAKPNIGERGNAVKKLFSIQDVLSYQQKTAVDFILQEWCNYENEIGVFYCRYPNQPKGFITGIVKKEFFALKGNGINTIQELICKEDRFFLQLHTLQKLLPNEMHVVLAKDEEKVLIPYGNHCRGTKFLNYSFKIDNTLQETFNAICSQIPNFYFGRMDIRFESWELLKQRKNFSIIELNGAGSEPTHIYDPKHSIFFAWKEIAKHLHILYTIAKQNKQLKGLSYLSLQQGIALFKSKKAYDKLINNFV